MNFIDYLLTDVTVGNIHNRVAEIAEIWNTVAHGLTLNTFARHPQHVKDLVHILNFDAAYALNGLAAFVVNSQREVFENTIKAFSNIDYEPAVAILRAVQGLHDVQSFYERHHKFSIKQQTLHEIALLKSQLQITSYNTAMWPRLERYLIKSCLKTQTPKGVSGGAASK